MNRILPIAIVVAVIAAGAYFLMGNTVQTVEVAQEAATSSAEASQAPAAGEETVAAEASAEETPATGGIQEMVLGDPNAPITIVEYASFTCPHCASFHEDTYPQLKADYVDTGKAKFIFREVYFDRFGLWASMIARCGGEERFFGITELMFKSQAEWSRAGDPNLIVGELRKIARLAGLSETELDACMQDEQKAQDLVAWYQENATRDDVNSTPTLVINGTKHGNLPYGELQALLDSL